MIGKFKFGISESFPSLFGVIESKVSVTDKTDKNSLLPVSRCQVEVEEASETSPLNKKCKCCHPKRPEYYSTKN